MYHAFGSYAQVKAFVAYGFTPADDEKVEVQARCGISILLFSTFNSST